MENETKKTTKAVMKKPAEKRKAVWAGAQSLMSKPKDQKEYNDRGLLLTASKVLGVSPFGVNILGTVPYLNKLGLGQKARQYGGATIQFKYDWVHFASDDKEKAICKCKIVSPSGKDLCDWVIGECSPVSMKMGTLAGYQNHMAQTRAHNRAVSETYGVRIHEEMMEKLQEMHNNNEVDDNQVGLIGASTSTSAEEMNAAPKQGQAQVFSRPPIEVTIASIRKAGDKQSLEVTRQKIKASTKAYTENQKQLILRAIDERIGELGGIKTIEQ